MFLACLSWKLVSAISFSVIKLVHTTDIQLTFLRKSFNSAFCILHMFGNLYPSFFLSLNLVLLTKSKPKRLKIMLIDKYPCNLLETFYVFENSGNNSFLINAIFSDAV